MRKLLTLFAIAALTISCGAQKQATTASEDGTDIGYGKVTKKHKTTAASEVEIDKKVMETYTDIYEYIQGKVPGVQVSGHNIVIRGVGTIMGGTEPLFIVDGTKRNDISDVNPYLVKNIFVLKDGSAAIYGSQGANGVIIINTTPADND